MRSGANPSPATLDQLQTVRSAVFIWLCDLQFKEPPLTRRFFMNRKSHGLSILKAIPGFIQYKAAEALSPTTLRSYADDLKKWLDRTGDKEVNKVTTEDLRAFFVWLRTEYKPRRFDGNTTPLSPKTVRNI
jgi:hypothetical protein